MPAYGLYARNARGLTMSNIRFLQLEGSANEAITLDGGDISKATSAVSFKDGATENSIKQRT
jgi:exopolysaccharide biosynthesis protein